MLNALVLMPALKVFFEKSPFTAYFNLVGAFTFVPIIILIALIVIIFVWKQKSGKQKKKINKK